MSNKGLLLHRIHKEMKPLFEVYHLKDKPHEEPVWLKDIDCIRCKNFCWVMTKYEDLIYFNCEWCDYERIEQ